MVRNLEKHKNTCSVRKETARKGGEEGTTSHPSTSSSALTDHDDAVAAASKTATAHVGSSSDAKLSAGVGDTASMSAQRAQAMAPGGADRTVTCMRCHESLPFHLVPSHSPKCKGGGGGFPTPGVTSAQASPVTKAMTGGIPTLSLPASSRRLPGTSGLPGQSGVSATATATCPAGGGFNPSPLPPPGYVPRGFSTRSPSTLSQTLQGAKARHSSAKIDGASKPVEGVPLSPPRPGDVRTWGTRQVTSWLRESMRPPRADVISRFHDSEIDGPALLELTDR